MSRRLRTKIAYEPDATWQDIGIEVKFQTHGFRNLRASLLGLAYWLSMNPGYRGVLLLVDSRITEEGLQKERRLAEQVLQPDILNRLTLAVIRGDQYVGLPPVFGEDFRTWLNQFVLERRRQGKRRDSSFYEIFQILVHQWLLGRGPVTTEWLQEAAGLSYPTVREALRRLHHYLLRSSDRRVELRYLPKDEWARLVAVSSEVRSTTRFADLSGQPRSPESHLRRLEKLNIPNLAVGGVIGAKHYYPQLDLVGTPRLDLCLHCPGGNMDLSFVGRLDPALRRIEDPLQPVNTVVHVVRRKDSFFEPSGGGLPCADPVECLLDLHEAHLESQAAEFLRALEFRRTHKP
jgi:hypothetical protein